MPRELNARELEALNALEGRYNEAVSPFDKDYNRLMVIVVGRAEAQVQANPGAVAHLSGDQKKIAHFLSYDGTTRFRDPTPRGGRAITPTRRALALCFAASNTFIYEALVIHVGAELLSPHHLPGNPQERAKVAAAWEFINFPLGRTAALTGYPALQQWFLNHFQKIPQFSITPADWYGHHMVLQGFGQAALLGVQNVHIPFSAPELDSYIATIDGIWWNNGQGHRIGASPTTGLGAGVLATAASAHAQSMLGQYGGHLASSLGGQGRGVPAGLMFDPFPVDQRALGTPATQI